MNLLTNLRFWGSLCGFGVINYIVLWIIIPLSVFSGNPGTDGVVVHGFPLITKTSGGCSMFGDRCMDFNLLHFWINLVILVTISVLMAYIFTKAKNSWSGVKNIGHYLLGWIMALCLLGIGIFATDINDALKLSSRWFVIVISAIYNLYYFLALSNFPFTLKETVIK